MGQHEECSFKNTAILGEDFCIHCGEYKQCDAYIRWSERMIDKNKVIEGLEMCQHGKCFDCPYWDGTIYCSKLELLSDALELLKDKENEEE